jgi:hypothetical protein
MAGREPQAVIDRSRRQAVRRLVEGGRLQRFFPGLAEVGGAENRRAEVAGLGRGQQRAAGARIESTTWLMVWPRKWGPSVCQFSRCASPWKSQTPLRVATRMTGWLRDGVAGDPSSSGLRAGTAAGR